MIDLSAFQDTLSSTWHLVDTELMSPWFYLQIALIVIAAGVGTAAATVIRARDARPAASTAKWPSPLRRLARGLRRSAGVTVFALLTLVMRLVMHALAPPGHDYLLAVVSSLAIAWLIIALAASLIRNDTVVRLVSLSAWIIAALSIVGLLDPTIDALDSVAIVVGGIRLTPLLAIKASLFLALALWLADALSRFLETRITHADELTPSLQVLLTKIIRLTLVAVAVMIAMAAVGINVSSLAVFTGAVGVGLGLGLQKIVSNFISGIILLTDKSVKPGDLITVGDSTGTISAMKTRYISVAAGDGREFLIPNEDLVTQKVVNWTYVDRNALVKVAFATSYDADPRAVCRLAVAIAAATPQVMAGKPPSCLLTEFGDNGMKFAMTFWIADLSAGTDNVRSEVMMALWDAFRREGIHAPVPVRDVRLHDQRPAEPLTAPRT